MKILVACLFALKCMCWMHRMFKDEERRWIPKNEYRIMSSFDSISLKENINLIFICGNQCLIFNFNHHLYSILCILMQTNRPHVSFFLSHSGSRCCLEVHLLGLFWLFRYMFEWFRLFAKVYVIELALRLFASFSKRNKIVKFSDTNI